MSGVLAARTEGNTWRSVAPIHVRLAGRPSVHVTVLPAPWQRVAVGDSIYNTRQASGSHIHNDDSQEAVTTISSPGNCHRRLKLNVISLKPI